jgi:hypothetical protein
LILSTVLGAIIGIPVVEYGTFVGFVLIYLMVGRHIPVMVLAMTLAFATPARGEPEWRFGGVDRLVAVADVHGAYGAFETILSRAGLIDATRNWTGAGTHLVIVGDVLDRGPDSRRALDLIMALATQADAAGGRVHFVLGNHEVMNLTGDLRYVSAAEFAAFAAEEPLDERNAGFETYRAQLGEAVDAETARRSFDAAYPLGYFAHRRAFASTGRYGAWLLEQPLLLVVGDHAFVHGGLAGAVLASGGELSSVLHQELRDYVTAAESLMAAGAVSRLDDFLVQAERAARLEGNAAAARLVEVHSKLLFAPDGPLWYRGNVSCNRLTEQDRLRATLAALGARSVVVGHTPSRAALVQSRMDETVLRIDTGMLREYYGGRASALVIEDGRLSAVYENESEPAAPVDQPRHVGTRPAGVSEQMLRTLLASARVIDQRAPEAGTRLVTLADGSLEIEALFLPAAQAGILPPVAAYRLDRLMGLDMVPVTVAREIDGVMGALQFWPAQAISEPERSAEGLGASAWCPLGDQIADMYRFDLLIFNPARTAERVRYSSEDFQLLLMGHELSFTTDRGRPAHLESLGVELTPAWRAALAGLDEASLTEALGDVLDRRRIRALLERRDAMLGSAGGR